MACKLQNKDSIKYIGTGDSASITGKELFLSQNKIALLILSVISLI